MYKIDAFRVGQMHTDAGQMLPCVANSVFHEYMYEAVSNMFLADMRTFLHQYASRDLLSADIQGEAPGTNVPK